MPDKFTRSVLALLIGCSILISGCQGEAPAGPDGEQVAAAPRPAPPNLGASYTFVPAADLDALMGPTRGDRPARVVDVNADARIGEYILHYPEITTELPASNFYHTEISELYYVIRGEGTALLGGDLLNPEWRPTDTQSYNQTSGPGVRGEMSGYTTHDWGPGDIMIVPAGVAHLVGFEVRETNDILRVVIDHSKVLGLVPDRARSLALGSGEEQTAPHRDPLPQEPNPPLANFPGEYTYIPSSDVEALMGPTRGDRPIRVVPIGNNANLGAYILHYEPMQNELPVDSFYHSEISELYYVIRGSGTALLGGELENAIWDDSDSDSIRQVRGPSANGTMQNFDMQNWTAGDTLIVPAGVPHSIGFEVTERTDILRLVFDPNRNIELR